MKNNGFITRIKAQVTKLEARQKEQAVRLCLTTEELEAAQAALRHATRRLERRA
jgi:hypothetical protein